MNPENLETVFVVKYATDGKISENGVFIRESDAKERMRSVLRDGCCAWVAKREQPWDDDIPF
tara:strand:+ start:1249 stop:1434 length:186 start_codon:yes stop_codon:yes gene_type:complete